MKRRSILPSAAAACLLLLGAGCASPDGDSPRDHAGQLRPVSLRGDALFFDGTLRVEATVSRVVGGGAGNDEGRRGSSGRGGRGRHRRDRADTVSNEAERSDELSVHIPRATGPALTLRVHFENLGKQPIDVQVRDVTSELGAFAVRPEHLLLASGQSSEVDPMVSQLGVVAARIPITVSLGIGARSEQQVIAVTAVEPAP